MKILVTGSAGFIGFHLSKKLVDKGYSVVGIDSINSYYDTNNENKKIKYFKKYKRKFIFKKLDLTNFKTLKKLFFDFKIDYVINLAAQAGVRYSIENPRAYLDSNLIGFFNVLECCKKFLELNILFMQVPAVCMEIIQFYHLKKKTCRSSYSILCCNKKIK